MAVLLDFDATRVGPPDERRRADPQLLEFDLLHRSFIAPVVFAIDGVSLLPGTRAVSGRHDHALTGHAVACELPLAALGAGLPSRVRRLFSGDVLMWHVPAADVPLTFERVQEQLRITSTAVCPAMTPWAALNTALTRFALKAHDAICRAHPEYGAHRVLRAFNEEPSPL